MWLRSLLLTLHFFTCIHFMPLQCHQQYCRFLGVSFISYCLYHMTVWCFFVHTPHQTLGPYLLLSYVCRPGIINPLQDKLILHTLYCAPEHVCDFPYVWLYHSKVIILLLWTWCYNRIFSCIRVTLLLYCQPFIVKEIAINKISPVLYKPIP